MVAETQQVETEDASNDASASEQSTETAEAVVEVAESQPSLADLLSSPDTFKEAMAHPAVQAEFTKAKEVAENAGKQKSAAAARKQFGNPEVVENAFLAIVTEAGLEKDSITRSMRDRANTIFSTARQAAGDEIAAEMPKTFFAAYELPQATLAEYTEKIAGSDYDGAFQALVDGAVSLKGSALEADFDKRVKAAASEMAKAELDAASGNGTTPIPVTSRGAATSNVGLSLTSNELEAVPPSVWVKLSDETKEQIYAGVAAADQERGKDTVDTHRMEQVAGLASP